MSLYDRAVKDNTRILTSEHGFTVPVVFTSPTGAEYPTRGFFIDVALDMDMATGLPKISRKCAFSFSIFKPDGTDLFTTENPWETQGHWKATFANMTDAAQTWTVDKQMPDKTMGMVTVILRKTTARTV